MRHPPTHPPSSIWRMNTDGSGLERVAGGIRNAAGLAFHPGTGRLLAAGMERDGMGNDRERLLRFDGGCAVPAWLPA